MKALPIRAMSALVQRGETDRAGAPLVRPATAAIRAGLDRARGSVREDTLERLIQENGPEAASRVRIRLDVLASAVRGSIRHGMEAGRRVADRHASVKLAAPEAETLLRGSVTKAPASAPARVSERGAAWAEKHSAKMIRSVNADTRATIREIITKNVAAGVHPSATAKQVKEVIGLNPQQARSVRALRRAQEKAGASAAKIDAAAKRYADRLLARRADTIARTETTRAVNMGRLDYWGELVDRGQVDPAKVTKTWMSARDERVDDICEALDGEKVNLVDDFSDGSTAPPDPHPSCRCTLLIDAG